MVDERQLKTEIYDIDHRHIHRYLWALKYVRGEQILDCSCGCGYGSFILGGLHLNAKVIGVDISKEAVAYAEKHYSRPEVTFLQGDMRKLNFTGMFNTIVSLESVEHVKNPKAVLQSFKERLLPGGNIIASIPLWPTVKGNPYHHFEVVGMGQCLEFFRSCGFKVVNSFDQDGGATRKGHRKAYGLVNLEPV